MFLGKLGGGGSVSIPEEEEKEPSLFSLFKEAATRSFNLVYDQFL